MKQKASNPQVFCDCFIYILNLKQNLSKQSNEFWCVRLAFETMKNINLPRKQIFLFASSYFQEQFVFGWLVDFAAFATGMQDSKDILIVSLACEVNRIVCIFQAQFFMYFYAMSSWNFSSTYHRSTLFIKVLTLLPSLLSVHVFHPVCKGK